MTARGSVALILHAHLPFVRHPERDAAPEEHWLFEAITESYVPLLCMMQRLRGEGLQFKITLSVSPTLASMLADLLLRERYICHLESLSEVADRECERNRDDPNLLPLSRWYGEFFSETRRIFVDEWNCDLLAIIRQLRDDGVLELIASAATHAILPILQETPPAARSQIAIGCDFYRDAFGADPVGFWLPECAYTPGIDELLQEQNIRWFAVDAHALEFAQPSARAGTLMPCFTPAGPAAFARDAQASEQIWDANTGYPGDANYRDFYRDVGFELSANELAASPCAQRQFTGIKYHRVTGGRGPKQLYVRATAEEMARTHAWHFIDQCLARLNNAEVEQPILLAPFDAELFGHWWFEGPLFLEHVIRAAGENKLLLMTPTEFLRTNPPLQIVQPSVSSWGDGGFFDVWLDERCGSLYPQLFAANSRMTALANAHAHVASAEEERLLRQLVRELLLAQASDWPFHIRNGTATAYATQRLRDHLTRFGKLADQLESQCIDPDFLAQCEERDNLFPHIRWQHYCHPERGGSKPRDPAHVRAL